MQTPRGTTGPTTEAGKQIASQNAAKHNCTSKVLVLAEENQADFDRLLAGLVTEYQPETEMQAVRVNEAARRFEDSPACERSSRHTQTCTESGSMRVCRG